jgi:Cu+-exporting ATPase
MSTIAGRLTPQEAAEVIDPVCGMTVRVATARHRSDWAGRSVYFCCARCKDTFEADPTRYVA